MNQQHLMQTLQQAVRLHQLGQVAAANELYQLVLSMAPKNADALRLSGVASMQLGQLEQAIATLEKARSLHPQSPEVLNNLGLAYKNAGDVGKAKSVYEDALRYQPNHADTLVNLGNLLLGVGQALAAAGIFERVVAAHPKELIGHLQLGNAYLDAGQASEAENAFSRALEFTPDSPDGVLGVGLALLAQNRLNEAVETLHQGMEKHEANPHLHNALGQAYQRRHQYELAVRHFQRTTELSPTLAAAFNNLGSALFTIAPAEEALKAYDRALELAPEMIAAWMNRAIATYSDEDVTSSLETVAASLEVQKTPIAEVYHGIFTHQKDPDSDLPDPEQWDDPEARSLASSYAYLASLNPTARCFANQRDIHRLAVEASPESGLVAEFGVFYGHSIRFLAECIATPIHGFDSFEGIPEGWFQGEDAGSYSTAGEIPPVPEHVTLHKGWFSDTLPGFAEEHGEPVRLLNIDCDIYSSTRTIFDNLGRFIQPGSILIFDEYGFYPGWEEHEHKAFLEFLQEHNWGSELLAYSLFSRQAVFRITSP